jgi:hypothetical protein
LAGPAPDPPRADSLSNLSDNAVTRGKDSPPMTLSMPAYRPWIAGAIAIAVAAPIAARTAPPATSPAAATTQAAATPRRIAVPDVDRIVSVRDPQRSPDGTWVTYGVSTVDVGKDTSDSDIWMVKWDGSERIRLTSSSESESAAKWSPDGKWISFLRPDEKKKAQVWTLSRLGGEAQKLTDVAGGVADYAWSPDSARLVIDTARRAEITVAVPHRARP